MGEIEDLVKSAIEKDGTSKVLEITLNKGSNTGDNVASDLQRVLVKVKLGDGTEKTLNLVCKSESDDPGAAWTKWMEAFRKESELYRTILPSLIDFQKEIGVKPLTISVPTYYDSVINVEGKVNRILLEDMRPLGFKMVDKYVALSHEEVLLALTDLGKFHGLSYAVKVTRNKGIHDLFPSSKDSGQVDDQPDTLFDEIITSHYRLAKNVFAETGRPDIAKCMEKYIGKEFEQMEKLSTGALQSDPYTVLNHGDFWTNNILIKYDADGKPEQVLILDFQLYRSASLFSDFLYFLFTSTTGGDRKKHLQTWLKHHHRELVKTIEHCKVPIPEEFSFANYEKRFREGLSLPAVHMCFAMPLQHADDEAMRGMLSVSIEERCGIREFAHLKETPVKKAYKCERVIKKLTEIMDDLIELGAF